MAKSKKPGLKSVVDPSSVDSITIKFGALCEPIDIQLKEQGIVSGGEEIRQIQQDADAIVRLSVRSLLSPTEVKSARTRLMSDLKQFLKENLGE